MSLLRRPLLLALLAVAMLGVSAAAWADPPRDRGRGAQHGQRQQAQRPRSDDALSDSVRRIERSTRGQVLSAERMQSDGRDVNRIKVVDDRGRVRVYMDDPQQERQQQDRRRPPTRDDDD
jgi:hypothetical protein